MILSFLMLATECANEQRQFAATYVDENENWEVQDMVNVTTDNTEHGITFVPK
ncbi:hypothetical protein [Bacillus marinisedimentorum]|uniref:hypothetical protein n=1 Tax=Bacillus marinisedimentorum TaxID=1821260 RepID=UPI001B80226A|nr:hypothetical protein [Bacillus marinisedimentorum]